MGSLLSCSWDEIHRFNKAQQDVILPHVENGTVTFIGATTENPSFEVIAPLLSRSRVFALHSLAPEEVATIVNRAAQDPERGLGELAVSIAPEAMAHLVNIANGDARIALNALETAAFATRPNDNGARRIDLDTIADALQRRSPVYDKAGDSHYDTISAFIKSVRGSSPDGALYWLARMLESGEDPLFIARRLVILAAEDIGLADPQALPLAVAAQQAAHFIGMPEGRIPLAEAAVYLAAAPKSNTAYAAINEAIADVRRQPNDPVPPAPPQRRNRPNATNGLRPKLPIRPRPRKPLHQTRIPAPIPKKPPLLPPRRPGRGKRDRRKATPLVGRITGRQAIPRLEISAIHRYKPSTSRRPPSTTVIISGGNSPTRSVKRDLSMVKICETFTTESLESPDSFRSKNTLPGALANRILEVMAATMTVLIRLTLNRLPWITKTGLGYPGPEPDGSGNDAHHISPRRITRLLGATTPIAF